MANPCGRPRLAKPVGEGLRALPKPPVCPTNKNCKPVGEGLRALPKPPVCPTQNHKPVGDGVHDVLCSQNNKIRIVFLQ